LPLYDYQCRTCQQVTEVRHGAREAFDGTCPACGGPLNRVFNPAGIVFKGSGFYVTDSRSSSGSSGESSGSSSSATGDGAPKSDTPKSDAPKSDAKKSESKTESSAA
jgi:putative FmdB family regulatory protein